MKHQATAITLASLIAVGSASAGTFLTSIIDGDFSEWGGIPILDSDPADNPGSVDIANVQLANDNDFLYISYTHHAALSVSTYIAIDSDSNTSTGYNIFGLGLVGAEAQWQNDFPFTSDTVNFNNGFGMSGDFFGSGAALNSPTGDAFQHELAISLDIIFNEDSSPVFDDDNFTLLLWTDAGAGDVSAAIPYTLAVPEPGTTSLLAACLGAGLFMRRRSRS